MRGKAAPQVFEPISSGVSESQKLSCSTGASRRVSKKIATDSSWLPPLRPVPIQS
jgi:hypothetical protein